MSAFKTIIIILSCIGAGLVIISTMNYGVGLSPDSIEFLAAADNLLLGRGLLSYNGLSITEWPPLYPILLFIFSYSLGISTSASAVLLNSLLFGLIIYRSGIILSRYVNNKFILVIGLLTVLFSIPVFSESLWAHSELLFIFFIVLYIDLLDSYAKNNNIYSFIVIIIVTALAILTRYIGIILIITTIITMLYYNSGNLKKKITSILIYSTLSALPISIWLIRNFMVSGTFFGERGASKYSFLFNTYLTINKILTWEMPDYLINLKIIFIIILVIITILIGAFLLKIIKYNDIKLIIDKRIFFILSLFILSYLLFLIIISSVKAHNSIDSRLLSPIYIPGIILLLVVLQACYNRIAPLRHFKLLRIVFFSFLVLGGAEQIYSTIQSIRYHYSNGQGYSGNSWQKYEIEQWLKINKENYIKGSVIYSNDPFAVYYLLNIYARWSPRKTYYDSDEIYTYLNDLEGMWPPENEAYLVWFNKPEFHRTQLYTPEQLASISDIKIIDSTPIASLYSVKILYRY